MLVDHLAEASMLEPRMAAAGAEALVVDVVVVGGRGGGGGEVPGADADGEAAAAVGVKSTAVDGALVIVPILAKASPSALETGASWFCY